MKNRCIIIKDDVVIFSTFTDVGSLDKAYGELNRRYLISSDRMSQLLGKYGEVTIEDIILLNIDCENIHNDEIYNNYMMKYAKIIQKYNRHKTIDKILENN